MESKIQFTRRNLFKTTLAAGLTSAAPVLTSVAQAAETEKKIRPLTGKMSYEEVRNRAREMMMPRCYVCPECNGRGPCIGQVPGFGGMVPTADSKPTTIRLLPFSSTAVSSTACMCLTRALTSSARRSRCQLLLRRPAVRPTTWAASLLKKNL